MVRPKKIISNKPAPKFGTLDQWLLQRAQQDTLSFVTCGNEGDGKSTLIGRLLWESRQLSDDQLIDRRADFRRHVTQDGEIDFALIVDRLKAEREQDINIDVIYRFFSTSRRKFIVADTPVHEQYTRNMVAGASSADAAVIVIDAQKGVLTQTRRQAFLLSVMGIKDVILAINKIDLIQDKQQKFHAIAADFSRMSESFGFKTVAAIPLSALKGDNVILPSASMPWYQGPTLMACLETIEIQQDAGYKMVFPVQWVNRPNDKFCGFSGTLASGQLKVGDEIRVTASGQTASISRLVTAEGDLPTVKAGDAVTIVLDREVDGSRSDVIALADQPLEMTDQFEATLVWLHEDPGLIGRAYEIKLANQWTTASLTALKYRVNANTQGHESCRQLNLNDIIVANLALSKPLVFSSYADSQILGGFILVDKFNHATVAAGMIRHNLRRAQNVHRQALSINREERERLNGHKGKVIWFTGLSGSGKSTIANALEKELHAQGKRTYILDGDNIRQGLNRDLGFTDADRVENIRRVAEVAKLMMDAGLIVMTAFISPFRAERQMARELIGKENFVEVFIDTPLNVCEQRDPKGLYKKARSGQIPNMTGINSPYEKPDHPDCVISHEQTNTESVLSLIMNFLR